MNAEKSIIVKIKERLNELAEKEKKAKGWDSKDWTKKIKITLCDLGHGLKYKARATGAGKHADDRAFLYDLVWLQYPIKDKESELNDKESELFIKDIPLVMESEWNPGKKEIMYDFQKLLIARSPLRLMIFQQETEEGIKTMMETFKKHINAFNNSMRGGVWLFAGYIFGKGQKKFLFDQCDNEES